MGVIREGVLERRGGGIVGKWEEQFFRVDGRTFDAFDVDDQRRQEPKRTIQVPGITELLLEEDKGEVSFLADGAKVRLRSNDVGNLKAWYIAIRNAIAGGRPSPSASPRSSAGSDEGSPEAAPQDVWVQIDQLTSLPRAGDKAAQYFVKVRWTRSSRDEGETEAREGRASPEDATEEGCLIRQQIFMAKAPGQQSITLSVYRKSSGATTLVGQTELLLSDPSVLKGQFYPLIDQRGKVMPAQLRMKIKPAAEQGDERAGQVGASQQAEPPGDGGLPGSYVIVLESMKNVAAAAIRPGRYYLTAKWEGASGYVQSDAFYGCESSNRACEDAFIRQQLVMGPREKEACIVLSLMRTAGKAPSNKPPENLGSVTLAADSPANTKSLAHALVASNGQATGASMKLKLRKAEAARSSPGDARKRSVSPRVIIETPPGESAAEIAERAQREADTARMRSARRMSVRPNVVDSRDEAPTPTLSAEHNMATLSTIDKFLTDEKLRVRDLFFNIAYNPNAGAVEGHVFEAAEVHAILSKAGLGLPLPEVQGLISAVDKSGTGKLDILDLENVLRKKKRGTATLEPNAQARSASPRRKSSVSPANVAAALRIAAASLTDDASPGESCLGSIQMFLDTHRLRTADIFRSAGYNKKVAIGDEFIDAVDLRTIMASAGVDIPAANCEALISSLDGGAGHIQIPDLENALRNYRRGKNLPEPKDKATTPRGLSSNRIAQLHGMHEDYWAKIDQKRAEREKQEDEEIAKGKAQSRPGRKPNHVAQPADTERLYSYAREYDARLRETIRKVEAEADEKLKASRAPRSKKVYARPESVPADAGHRLHALHGEKLAKRGMERDKVLAAELGVHEATRQAAPASAPGGSRAAPAEGETTPRTPRHQELYEEWKVKAQKMELLQVEKARQELQHRKPSAQGRSVDMVRVQELFEGNLVKEQKLQKLARHIEEKNRVETEKAKQQARAKSFVGKQGEVQSKVVQHLENVFLKQGMIVRIIEDISYEYDDPKYNYQLHPGMLARVQQAEEKGDVLLRFVDFGDRWVLKRHFNRLTIVSDARELANLPDFDAPVTPRRRVPPSPPATPRDKRPNSCTPRGAARGDAPGDSVDGDGAAKPVDGPAKPICGRPVFEQAFFGSHLHRDLIRFKKPVAMCEVSDHILEKINRLVASRCGRAPTDVNPQELRRLLPALTQLLETYRDAKHDSDQCKAGAKQGTDTLVSMDSQRLFMDGHLLDDTAGALQCIEPDPIRQPEEDFEMLLAAAEDAHWRLCSKIGPESEQLERNDLMRCWPTGDRWSQPRVTKKATFAYNPGPKDRISADHKAFVRYGPAEGMKRFRHLLDLARVSLVFPNAALLYGGLQEVMAEFEVVDVRNRYNPAYQNIMNERCIEVSVIVKGKGREPHICEIRLEEMCYFMARQRTQHLLQEVMRGFSTMYEHTGRDPGVIEYLVKWVLTGPADSHKTRTFRRHLARKYGSLANVWRRPLGGTQLVNFRKFRDVCQSMNWRDNTVRFWQDLDCSRAGVISLFELDPDGVVLLIKLYGRLMGLSKKPEKEVTNADLLAQLTSRLPKLNQPGRFEVNEFRVALKPLGFDHAEADRLYTYLDTQADLKPEATRTIGASDIGFLLKLPHIVDMDTVMLTAHKPGELESTRCVALGGVWRPQEQRRWRFPNFGDANFPTPRTAPSEATASADAGDPVARINAQGRVYYDAKTGYVAICQPIVVVEEEGAMGFEDIDAVGLILDDVYSLCRMHMMRVPAELTCCTSKVGTDRAVSEAAAYGKAHLIRQYLVERGVPAGLLSIRVQSGEHISYDNFLRFDLSGGPNEDAESEATFGAHGVRKDLREELEEHITNAVARSGAPKSGHSAVSTSNEAWLREQATKLIHDEHELYVDDDEDFDDGYDDEDLLPTSREARTTSYTMEGSQRAAASQHRENLAAEFSSAQSSLNRSEHREVRGRTTATVIKREAYSYSYTKSSEVGRSRQGRASSNDDGSSRASLDDGPVGLPGDMAGFSPGMRSDEFTSTQRGSQHIDDDDLFWGEVGEDFAEEETF